MAKTRTDSDGVKTRIKLLSQLKNKGKTSVELIQFMKSDQELSQIYRSINTILSRYENAGWITQEVKDYVRFITITESGLEFLGASNGKKVHEIVNLERGRRVSKFQGKSGHPNLPMPKSKPDEGWEEDMTGFE